MGKSGSTTIEPALWAAPRQPDFRSGLFLSRADAVEQLSAGDERHTQAGRGEDQAGVTRIILQIMDASLDGADGDRVGYEIRFQTRLDDKQATDFPKHRHC
jgi:hypothetical protein